MELKFNKEYGKDWIIKNGHIELIGQYKKDFQSGKIKPKKATGHRLTQFLGIDFFVPPWMAQAEALKIWEPVKGDDGEINMLTGQVGEQVIVNYLNKQFDSKGETFPYETTKGDAFKESRIYGGLPDYITEGKYKIFEDNKKLEQQVIEIKTTGTDKFARDYTNKNYKLQVLDNSLTVDNIVDNPSRDMIKEIYKGLSKKDLAKFTASEKKEVENYVNNINSKSISKKFYVQLLTKYGITKDMILGDPLHNKKPILKNTKNIKVSIMSSVKDYGKKSWSKNGKYFPKDDYIYQVSLYTFLYQLKMHPNIKPENLKGIINSEIDVLFVDNDQFVIPKDSWINKFNYQPSQPRELKIELGKNFQRIKLPIDLHKFYETVIKPCNEIYENTIDLQKTQNITPIGWNMLKKAFLENGYSLDQFMKIQKENESKEVVLIKETVEDYNTKKEASSEEKAKTEKLLNLFNKEKQKTLSKASQKLH